MRADGLQQVVVEREQGAARAEARVRAHAEREQQGAELAVGEGCEVAVVVEREVLDEQRGHEAGAERVDRERHRAGEGVAHLLVHDVDELRLGLGARPASARALVVAVLEAREHLAEDGRGARHARVHEVRDHVAPEVARALRELEDDRGPVRAQVLELEREAVEAAEHARDLLAPQRLAHRDLHARAVAVLHGVDELRELAPALVVHLGRDELVDDVQRARLARPLRLPGAARAADGAALGEQQARDVGRAVAAVERARAALAAGLRHASGAAYTALGQQQTSMKFERSPKSAYMAFAACRRCSSTPCRASRSSASGDSRCSRSRGRTSSSTTLPGASCARWGSRRRCSSACSRTRPSGSSAGASRSPTSLT